jgi:hypothetical protein
MIDRNAGQAELYGFLIIGVLVVTVKDDPRRADAADGFRYRPALADGFEDQMIPLIGEPFFNRVYQFIWKLSPSP